MHCQAQIIINCQKILPLVAQHIAATPHICAHIVSPNVRRRNCQLLQRDSVAASLRQASLSARSQLLLLCVPLDR